MNTLTDSLSIHWPMLLAQATTFLVVAAVFIGLAIHATRRVLRRYDVRREETRTVIWIAVIWLVPVLGPLLAMSAADSITAERSSTLDHKRPA